MVTGQGIAFGLPSYVMRFTKSTEACTFSISVWARNSAEAPAANVSR